MENKRRNQSRYRPDINRHQGTRIGPRDLEIFKEILNDRFLSTYQIQEMFFNSYKPAARRLQGLWNQGYLRRKFFPITSGSQLTLYYLQKKAYDFLVLNGIIDPEETPWKSIKDYEEVKFDKEYHELACNQFKVAIVSKIKNYPDLELIQFGQGPVFWDYAPDQENPKRKIPIRPDRFMVVKTKDNFQTFFIEVDQGTMTLERFRTKIRGYRNYYYSKGFYKKYGDPQYPFEDYSYRVLTIAISEERRNNLLDQALKEKSLYMCWFTAFKEATNNPFEKVWIRGKEYKEELDKLPSNLKDLILDGNFKTERNKIIKEIPKFSLYE